MYSLLGQKVPVLFHRSTEQNPKTSVAYLNDFDQTDLSCAFGSVVLYVLKFWRGNRMLLVRALLC